MPLGLGAAGGRRAPRSRPIISRSAWGADESLRFDAAGDEQWPREYYPVQKLVVHHTAGRNSDPDPAATVRAIYYYHAVTRRWADIGYNYLIDEAGRVYEGRYARDFWNGAAPSSDNLAGLGVAAGHTKYYNQGTMGISLLGTFTSQAPTAAARASLVRMLAWASAKYHIDPTGSDLYVNPETGVTGTQPNIAGHRDYASTACPGGVLYSQLPVHPERGRRPGEHLARRDLQPTADALLRRRHLRRTNVQLDRGHHRVEVRTPSPSASSAPTDQASTVPQPGGNWYYVTAGVWAGYWVQASSGITLGCGPVRAGARRLRHGAPALRPRRDVRRPQVQHLRRRDRVQVDAPCRAARRCGPPRRARSPSQAGNWYYVTVGVWEGYWIPESAGMTLGAPPPPLPVPIAIYNPPRTVLIAPGTYVGRRFSQYGISAGTWTATLTTPSSAPTSRYSTLPGQSGNWYYIIDGEFESYWLLDQPGVTLAGPPTRDLSLPAATSADPGRHLRAAAPARLLDSARQRPGGHSAGVPRTFQDSARRRAGRTAVTGNLTSPARAAGYAFLGPATTRPAP